MDKGYRSAEKIINAFLLWSGHVLGRGCRLLLVSESRNGRRASEKTLKRILRRNRNTEIGRRYGFGDIGSAEEYQNAVPLSSYDDYRPYIDRMINAGENGLITAGRIRHFATTTGTVGERKLIPLAPVSYIPHLLNTLMLADDLYASMRARGLRRRYGKGFITTEISSAPAGGAAGKKLTAEGVSSFAVDRVKMLFPVLLSFPAKALTDKGPKDMRYLKARYALQDPDLVFMGGIFMSSVVDIMTYIVSNHEMLIRDIEEGTIDSSIVMSGSLRSKLTSDLSPDPVRAAELRRIFETPDEGPLISRIWKDMSMIAGIGTGEFKPFTDTLRAMCDEKVSFQFMSYASSEAVFGSVMGPGQTDCLLYADSGFYEFIPVDGDAGRPLLMHELRPGGLYEIVVTNLSGLYRYMIRDVVRVTRYEGETPYVEFAYRANQITNICGIHLTGEHLAAAVQMTENETGVRFADYSIYADSGEGTPLLQFFFETDGGETEQPESEISESLDKALRTVCRGYELHRSNGEMRSPRVTELEPGTYMRYREKQLAEGASANQLKALRVIKDMERYRYFSGHTLKAAGETEEQ